jgi:MFS family permease
LVQPLLQNETIGALIVSFQAGIYELNQYRNMCQHWLLTRVHHSQHGLDDEYEYEHDNLMNGRKSTTHIHRSNLLPIPTLSDKRNITRSASVGNIPLPLDTTPKRSTRTIIDSDTLSIKDISIPSSKDNNNTMTQLKYNMQTSLSQSDLLTSFDQPFYWRTEYILLKIHAAHRELVQANSFVAFLAKPFDISIQQYDVDDYDDDLNQQQQSMELLKDINVDENDIHCREEILKLIHHQNDHIRTPKQQLSDYLNLMSTFLYMTNYYIVAPTSSRYAMKLGGSPSIASMIIGMTPVAALVSTILYSWWTSTSYKPALLFASSCSLIGNILYSIGLPFNSIVLVMLGRLLNGFGSARSINRRYIADVFTKEHRTVAAAIFVTAGALGMSAGPAIAAFLNIILSHYPTSNLYWQQENAPGTFMAVLWAVYIIFFILFFEDPIRTNIKTHDSTVKATSHIKGTNGEKIPLLLVETKHDTNINNSATDEIPIWRNTPAMMTFFIYFVLKLCLESVLSATSVLTGFYFGWDATVMGLYLATLGLLMLPANIIVAYFARQSYEDREMIVVMIVGIVIGCFATIQYCTDPHDYSLIQFIIGSVILFVSATALEGPTMSLLSKAIPKSWSKGFFNVGLLATEAGTFGRVVADIFLSTVGASGGLEHLLNLTFGMAAAVTSLCLALTLYFHQYMEPFDQDD